MPYILQVSDPFELAGQTLEVDLRLEKPSAWLVELVDPISIQDTEYRYLVVNARHEGKELGVSKTGKAVPCNMTRIPAARARTDNPCDLSWWRGGHAMIGTIRKGG